MARGVMLGKTSFLRNQQTCLINMSLMKIFTKNLNKGEILIHKEDFCFVPKGKIWNEFNTLFSWGVILKYIPDKKNCIDYEALKLHQEMERRRQLYSDQSKPAENLLYKESQLFSSITSPQKGQKGVKPNSSRIPNDNYKFLNYDNPFKNGISRNSVDSGSADVSNFEPEFLKNHDSSEEGSDCVELGKSQDNVFFKEILKSQNPPSQPTHQKSKSDRLDVPGNSRYKVKNEDTNIVKEKLQRKAKENFLNASFIQPSRQDLDIAYCSNCIE